MTVSQKEFLKELKLFLHIDQFENVIDISKLSVDNKQWMKTMLANEQNTIAKHITHDQISSDVITKWAFYVSNDMLEYKEMRKCDTSSENKNHLRN